ncbi:MAG: GxxExxY protein [Spirochaetota bacterium]|nr:GxxExxY protein [Spirochaetota bacterium]NMB72682.1 GxxExxY protein [Bacteroidales bacterium]
MKYESLTEQILGCAFEVINELGSGFLESVYEKAMLIVLKEKGLSVVNQFPVHVYFRNNMVGVFYADLFVENKVIVELKAVKSILPEHKAQVINYLKGTGIEVGLLLNFGSQKLEFNRLYLPESTNPDNSDNLVNPDNPVKV